MIRILVIKLGSHGDVIRATSLIPGLKRLYPTMELTWVTAHDAIHLVTHHPDIKTVYSTEGFHAMRWAPDAFDWVLSLDDEREACQLASGLKPTRFSGAYEEKNKRINYTKDLSEWFGMGLLRPPEQGGLTEANRLKKENTKTFGEIHYSGLGLPGPVSRPRMYFLNAHAKRASQILQEAGIFHDRPVIGLNTSAGPRWKNKIWSEAQTIELARRLHDEIGANVLLLGGASETERNERIFQAVSRPRVITTPTHLSHLVFAALVNECDLIVSSDSLAMHFGIALEKPVIAFFGPTSSAEIDLFGLGEKIITPLDCRCCYQIDCSISPTCTESITTPQIFEAVSRWLPVEQQMAA